jgi:hypothetical protein
MIRWEDIGRVGCLSRHDGTIRELQIDAGARRIEVGSLGVCDLSAAYAVILAHSPRGTAQACHEAWDQ